MDIKVEMNTGNEAVTNFTTDLNGELKAIIMKVPESVTIKIISEHGYEIFDKADCVGDFYMPITITPISRRGHKRSLIATCMYLDEKVQITVSGRKNANVTLIFRVE